jgi:hypothetical protein
MSWHVRANHLERTSTAMGKALREAGPDPPFPEGGTEEEREHWLRSDEVSRRYKPPGRAAVERQATRIAEECGADTKKTLEILYSRGDLMSYLPCLLAVEEYWKRERHFGARQN